MTPPRSIALFGGSFDPVHLGHVEMARRAVEAMELDQVRFSNRGGALRPSDVTPAERRRLWPLFADDVARLEAVLGRDLSAWDPERAEASAPAPGTTTDDDDRATAERDAPGGRATGEEA